MALSSGIPEPPSSFPRAFRIIVIGGSNTFGVSVNDGETYPARLEQYLEKIAPGKFEVWNAGLSAYVLSQVVEYAKIVTKEYEPDLLILQLANQGRRPFFYKGDLRFFFHKNKELYTENIPLVYSSNPLIQKLHNYIIQRYRTYCLIMSLINNHVFIKPTDTWQEKEQSLFCKRANTIGDTISMRDYDQFIEEYSHKVPMALIHACENDILKFSQETPHLQLAFDIMPKEYREIHPPDYVYEWYAKEIVKELLRNQLITTK